MSKFKAIGSALRRLVDTKAMFGDDIARLARREGVLTGSFMDATNARRGLTEKIMGRLGRKMRFYGLDELPEGRGVFLRNVYGWAEPAKGMRTVGPALPQAQFLDKVHESQVFRGSIPKAMRIRDILSKYKIRKGVTGAGEQLRSALQKELGPQHILKPIEGSASAGGLLTEASKLPNSLAGTEGMMAQTRIPLRRSSAIERAVDQAAELAGFGTTRFDGLPLRQKITHIAKNLPQGWKQRNLVGTVKGKGSVTTKGTKEYRVHTFNGQVIRDATLGRGSLLSSLNPILTPGKRRAEKAVEATLAKVPAKHRKGTYAFDVGEARKGRKPVIIEANPSDATGNSGFVDHPFVVDALVSRTMGKVPLRRRAHHIAGGALAAGPIGYAANRYRQKQASITKEVPMQVISSTLKAPKATFTAEVADTDAARRAGLSKRAALPEGRGMFFDIAGPFWMKDVNFPLDLVHLTKSGEIVDIQTMHQDFMPDRMKRRYWTMDPKAAYALELPGGWCKRRAVKPGDRVTVLHS